MPTRAMARMLTPALAMALVKVAPVPGRKEMPYLRINWRIG